MGKVTDFVNIYIKVYINIIHPHTPTASQMPSSRSLKPREVPREGRKGGDDYSTFHNKYLPPTLPRGVDLGCHAPHPRGGF